MLPRIGHDQDHNEGDRDAELTRMLMNDATSTIPIKMAVTRAWNIATVSSCHGRGAADRPYQLSCCAGRSHQRESIGGFRGGPHRWIAMVAKASLYASHAGQAYASSDWRSRQWRIESVT